VEGKPESRNFQVSAYLIFWLSGFLAFWASGLCSGGNFMKRLLFFSIVIFVLSVQTSLTQIPNTISYQGVLTVGGTPIQDGNYRLVFKLYETEAGGSQYGLKFIHRLLL
jgi:hypothetical protein